MYQLSSSKHHGSKCYQATVQCWRCKEDFQVVLPCCVEETSYERFLIGYDSTSTTCAKCSKPMMKMPCCYKFQLMVRDSNSVNNCNHCKKSCMACECACLNLIPPKCMSRACANLSCHYKFINCECNNETNILMNGLEKYCCPSCEMKFEYDIDIGVKKCNEFIIAFHRIAYFTSI